MAVIPERPFPQTPQGSHDRVIEQIVRAITEDEHSPPRDIPVPQTRLERHVLHDSRSRGAIRAASVRQRFVPDHEIAGAPGNVNATERVEILSPRVGTGR